MFQSKAATYAILAVVEIARRQRDAKSGVQAGEVARHFGLPPAYAAKVMTQLARRDILRSDRGPRGGFRLKRGPDQIHFLEIVEAVDRVGESADWSDCEPRTRHTLDGVRRIFQRVDERARELLREVTVADFLAQNDGDSAGRSAFAEVGRVR